MSEETQPRCQQVFGILADYVPGLANQLNSSPEADCPHCSQPMPARDDIRFANDQERQFAQILDSCHIRWEYEPKTFELEHNGDGDVTNAFSPDFYLLDYDFWIEFTVLRQCLTTKKHRKIRLTCQIFGVRVELVDKPKFTQLVERLDNEGLIRFAQPLSDAPDNERN